MVWSFTWIDDRKLAACSAPASHADLASLRAHGISLVVNLLERSYPAGALAPDGLRELHVPVRDMTAPSLTQIETVMSAVDDALASGEAVAVHCAAGIGRAGTLAACHLVKSGMTAHVAIARVRELRPGSIEMPEQEAAVTAYAARRCQR